MGVEIAVPEPFIYLPLSLNFLTFGNDQFFSDKFFSGRRLELELDSGLKISQFTEPFFKNKSERSRPLREVAIFINRRF